MKSKFDTQLASNVGPLSYAWYHVGIFSTTLIETKTKKEIKEIKREDKGPFLKT